jgi:hypothetical protein
MMLAHSSGDMEGNIVREGKVAFAFYVVRNAIACLLRTAFCSWNFVCRLDS